LVHRRREGFAAAQLAKLRELGAPQSVHVRRVVVGAERELAVGDIAERLHRDLVDEPHLRADLAPNAGELGLAHQCLAESQSLAFQASHDRIAIRQELATVGGGKKMRREHARRAAHEAGHIKFLRHPPPGLARIDLDDQRQAARGLDEEDRPAESARIRPLDGQRLDGWRYSRQHLPRKPQVDRDLGYSGLLRVHAESTGRSASRTEKRSGGARTPP
jgi:hypothetical protein